MAQKSFTQTLVGWIVGILEDAKDLLTGEDTRRAIITDLGGKPPAGPGTPPEFPPAGLASAKAYRDATDPDLIAFFAAIQDVRAIIDVIRSFVDSLDLEEDDIADEVFRDLLDLLALNFVRLRAPRLYYWMQAVSFAEDFSSLHGGRFGGMVGVGRGIGRIFEFLCSPSGFCAQVNFDDETRLQRVTDTTLQALAGLAAFGRLHVPKADDVMYGWDLVPGVPGTEEPTAVDRALGRMLTLKFTGTDQGVLAEGPPLTGTSLTSVTFLPRSQGGPGLFLLAGGGFDIDAEIDAPWYLSTLMGSTGAVGVLVRGLTEYEIAGPDVGSDFRGGLAVEARPDPVTHKAFDIRFAKDTGLSIGLLRFEVLITEPELTVKTTVRQGVLSVGKVFDNFLDRLIPGDGLRVVCDFAVGYGTVRGAFLEGQVPSVGPAGAPAAAPPQLPRPGGAIVPPPLPPIPREEAAGTGVSLRIPVGKSLGFLTIHDAQVRIGYEGDGDQRAYLLNAAASLSIKLGPVTARVDRMGVGLKMRVPDDPADRNLGFCDLDLSPLLPNGVGLAIDAKGSVTGGGFLFRDHAQGVYAGVMHLTLQERITVKAFGLVATKLPDGRPGYSLIIFITAEDFKPIPLGMAATLQGLGGIIAINRTFDEEAMRQGLRNKTLGTLLFPRDPIRNAPEIIRNLAVTFPAKDGAYLFGILAKIGWYSPPLVRLDLALILEFGSRRRLIALGRISALLPSPDNDLVRLNLDALGIIDLDQGTASIDAVLVDSKLAKKFVLTGAMALRARWTAGPGAGFILAVGGFNPRFVPPAGLPKLERVTIALSAGSNPRLTCAAYLAITSNTIQFGARAELYASAHGFSIEGAVGFDVLIHLSPFHFIADFHASIQLKRGSRNLFKVSVTGELEGPRPLRVSGKASFEIFWCDFTVRFDKTLIAGEKPPLPPAVNVLSELSRVVAAPESWGTALAPNRQHGVTLRTIKPGPTLVLDPLGNLTVRQSVVPLNTSRDLDTFGGAPIAGARRFVITATLNGRTQQTAPLRDQFVPAQFFAMTDEEKLSSPSFGEMESGMLFGSDAVTFADNETVPAPLKYQTIILGEPAAPPPEPYDLSADGLAAQAAYGAVARAAVRRIGAARFRDPDAPQVATVLAPRYAIASLADTATTAPLPAASATWAEARGAVTALNRSAAPGARQWQLVPLHELAG